MFGLKKGSSTIVQGITGHQGRFHSGEMMAFGTNIVAGVVPAKRGEKVDDIQVYDSVREVMKVEPVDCSVVFVPAVRCLEAVSESIDAGISIIVVITEHVPLRDEIIMRQRAKAKGVTVIGPNCPGLCIPGVIKLGIMPNMAFMKGNVGVVSRSGTLTYEVVRSLTDRGIGQRACVGIGGDMVPGTSMKEALAEMIKEPELEGIVMIGEIGGNAEQMAADFLEQHYDGPVVAYIAGRTAPADKRMGHAGAIISGRGGSHSEKVRYLADRGITVCDHLEEIPDKYAHSV